MNNIVRLSFVASIAGILTLSSVAQAETFTLSAVQDTYLPSGSGLTDTVNNGLGVVITGGSPSSARKSGLYQFDLSGLTGEILSAHIELYDTGTDSLQANAFSVDHYFVTPDPSAMAGELIVTNSAGDIAWDQDGIHQDYVTYNSYYPGAAGASWIESTNTEMMTLNLDADNVGGQWYASADANATDLGILNDNMNDHGYVVVLGWRQVGSRAFGDSEAGFAPRLVVDLAAVPEPGTFSLLFGGLASLLVVRARRAK